MKLNKIFLNNIRSYKETSLNIPEGSSLLSGDIGSGKTTILLGIEFALFGLRKGELSGEALLRKGTKDGFVELNFSIDDKNYVIKRTLKKTSTSVSQGNGFFSINGEVMHGSPVELKQKVLETLNYPLELLTKSKAFIYRYTVFTPQEEMKSILLGDSSVRLDTLRRIFGIDKYKRIKENSKVITQKIREKIKNFEGRLMNFDNLQNELKTNKNLLDLEKNKLSPLIISIEKFNNEINEKKEVFKLIQKKIQLKQELNKDKDLKEISLKYKNEKIDKNKQEIKLLEESILKLKEEIVEIDFKPEEFNSLKNEILNVENKLRETENKSHAYKFKIDNSKELINKISSLNDCPVCMQSVNEDYKSKIKIQEESKINEANSNLNIIL